MTLKYHNIESFRRTILTSCYSDIYKARKLTKTTLERYQLVKNKTEKVLERIEMLKTILNYFEDRQLKLF